MQDGVSTPTTTEQKTFGKPVSAGKVQAFKPNISLPNDGGQQNNGEGQGAAATETAEQIAAKANEAKGLNSDGTPKTAAPAAATTEITKEQKEKNIAEGLNEDGTPKNDVGGTLTDESVLEYLKSKGKTLASLDEITNPTVTLTEEQKAKAEQAFEKRMLDLFVENGGKIEQFAAFKQIANSDLTELSKSELTRELKAEGFSDDEIALIQKERYFQMEQAEIDEIEDPAEKALAQKKLDYGKKKLEGKASHTKTQAAEILNTLKAAVNERDLQATKESEFSSNVEEHFKKVERKLALQLGKSGDDDIAPVEYEVPETVIEEAKNVLKDKELRKQFLYNSDGSLNLANLSETILKAKMFDSAAKTAYLTGGHRQVEAFEKIFPKNPNALGVGGNNSDPKKGTGKIVSAGQAQRFRPAVNQ